MAEGGGGDYKVGYRKPPLHTRFRKGYSGNLNGRPRGSRSTAVVLREALQTKVTVNKSGKVMSKREAIIIQQVNKAAAGDRQAAYFVLLALDQLGAMTCRHDGRAVSRRKRQLGFEPL